MMVKGGIKLLSGLFIFLVVLIGIFLFSQFSDFTITGHVIAYNGSNVVYRCGEIDQSGIYTMNQSLSTTAVCLTINVSDVSLDCQNFNLDGDDSGTTDYGIFLDGAPGVRLTNVTIMNCDITDFYNGISTEYTDSSFIDNVTLNSNSNGIFLLFSDSNNLTNIVSKSNSDRAIYISLSDSNNLINVTTNSNSFYGIYISLNSDSNNLINVTANSNGLYGIYIDGNLNKIINSTINSQSGTNDVGIFIDDDHNIIENTSIKSNYRGIYLDTTADNNTIVNNTIEDNSNYGIYFNSAGLNIQNLIYNNLLNNTVNLFFSGTVYENYWNTTLQNGSRIYSNGTQIGGNYYTNYSSIGTGFSDICVDSDFDGFCDLGYNVTNDVACTIGVNCSITNTDYLALSDDYILDTTNPTATFTCNPSIANVGDTITCVCSGTDVGTGLNDSLTSSQITITATKTGTFTVSGCSVTDNAGNTATAIATYTVEEAPTVVTGALPTIHLVGTPTLQKSHLLTKVNSEEETTLTSFENVGIKELTILTNQEATNVRIKVSVYDEKPTEVSVENSGKTYRYLQISTENLNEVLEKATVKFEVEKFWVSDNGLDKNDLVVLKFDEQVEVWNELETIFDSEDDNFYVYKIELDSFSFFAIGEKIKEVAEGISEIVEEKIGGKNFKWLWLVFSFILIIWIVVVIIYIVRKKREVEFSGFNNIEILNDNKI